MRDEVAGGYPALSARPTADIGASAAEAFALDMVRRTCEELAMTAPRGTTLPRVEVGAAAPGAAPDAAQDAAGWTMVRASTRDRPLPLGLCTGVYLFSFPTLQMCNPLYLTF